MKAQYQTFMKITQNSEKSTKEIYEDENEDFIKKWKIPEMYSIYIYTYIQHVSMILAFSIFL